jgi:lipoate---protein ligase
MLRLDLKCADPAENVALDEALLDQAEADDDGPEILRLWEPAAPLVVVGRSSKVAVEVQLDECRRRGVPILRRASGGAAIVTGPGCLMYAVVLSYTRHPELRMLDQAHQYVLSRIAAGLSTLGIVADICGTSDLARDGRKFSGNSLRCKREHFLYHGTLLYDFDLSLISSLLGVPPRVPEYRANRPHEAFVGNLQVPREALVGCLASAFGASELMSDWPVERTRRLIAERYGRDSWNFAR